MGPRYCFQQRQGLHELIGKLAMKCSEVRTKHSPQRSRERDWHGLEAVGRDYAGVSRDYAVTVRCACQSAQNLSAGRRQSREALPSFTRRRQWYQQAAHLARETEKAGKTQWLQDAGWVIWL